MIIKGFPGGIHPHLPKSEAARPIEILDAPKVAVIPLRQHIGAAAQSCVNVGDRVLAGQVIAKSSGFVSADIHSSIAGKVVAIEERPHPLRVSCPSIIIENDGTDQKADPGPAPGLEANPAEMLKSVAAAGIVGMGGATFPSHVKLSPPPGKPIDTVIINGAECEPILTADHRLMVEHADRIAGGARGIAHMIGANRVIVAIEDNKPDAVKMVKRAVEDSSVEVMTVRTRYPQGGEKQLIASVLGRKVPAGGLPMDVGVVVHNTATASAIYGALVQGTPLIERILTLTGRGVGRPGNLLVRLGTLTSDLLALRQFKAPQGGFRLIHGGPMMGLSQATDQVPVCKGTSGILILDPPQNRLEQDCIRCGKCVSVCPMNLLPSAIVAYSRIEDWRESEARGAMHCIECGCCSYVCPAGIQLTQRIARTKAVIAARARKAKEESSAKN